MSNLGIIASGYQVPAAAGLTPTMLASGSVGWAPAATFAINSVSPGANCVLVLLVGGTRDGSWSSAIFMDTVVTSGAAADFAVLTRSVGSATFSSVAGIAWVAYTTDPGTFNITTTSINNFGSYSWSLYKLTGHNTTTPLGGKVVSVNAAGNGAVNQTLDAAPATGDYTLAHSHADTDTGSSLGAQFNNTAGTWTETAEGNNTTACSWNTGYRTASTSTTVPWSDVATGGGGVYTSAQAAVVVKAA